MPYLSHSENFGVRQKSGPNFNLKYFGWIIRAMSCIMKIEWNKIWTLKFHGRISLLELYEKVLPKKTFRKEFFNHLSHSGRTFYFLHYGYSPRERLSTKKLISKRCSLKWIDYRLKGAFTQTSTYLINGCSLQRIYSLVWNSRKI